MVKYGGAEGEPNYEAKFVRVNNDIHTTIPNDMDTEHRMLAVQDGIQEQIETLVKSDPINVDGGFMEMVTNRYGHHVILQDGSASLGLPKTPDARIKTIEILREQTLGYKVVDLDHRDK